MNISGKYQNQYTTKCQAQIRETEIQQECHKIVQLHAASCTYIIYVCVCVCVYTHIHRVIQKSPHNGKMVSLFKKNVLSMGTITLKSHADASPLSRRTTSGVMCAQASLMRSFRWPVLCSFTSYSRALKCTRK